MIISRESPIFYVWEGNKLIDVQINYIDATQSAPTKTELEIVRIFKEYKQLRTENKRLKEIPGQAICAYCGKKFDALAGDSKEKIAGLAADHIVSCKKNPLVQTIKQLKAWQETMQNDVDKAHDDEIELLALRDENKQLKGIIKNAKAVCADEKAKAKEQMASEMKCIEACCNKISQALKKTNG